MSRRNRRRRGGFTLMEVLLVLAILVILGALAFFSFGGTLFTSNKQAAKIQIDGLKTPIREYALNEGGYPQTLADLWTPSQRTGRTYLDAPLPLDPWGNEYQYQPPPDPSDPNPRYRVWSNGPNGQQGDGDDISNLAPGQQ